MSSSFTPAATRLAGLATALFHWTPDQFWHATPHELADIFAGLSQMRGEGGDAGALPPDAASMAALMERFPDR